MDDIDENSLTYQKSKYPNITEASSCLSSPAHFPSSDIEIGEIAIISLSGNLEGSSKSSSSISSSTSGWSAYQNISEFRSPTSLSQNVIPPLDSKILQDLELQAHKISESLTKMLQDSHDRLHIMSSLTGECLEVYNDAVNKTCDSVDASIKSMYVLMARCEELNKSVQPIYFLQDKIRDIKRLLDGFEKQLNDDHVG